MQREGRGYYNVSPSGKTTTSVHSEVNMAAHYGPVLQLANKKNAFLICLETRVKPPSSKFTTRTVFFCNIGNRNKQHLKIALPLCFPTLFYLLSHSLFSLASILS